MTTEIFGMLTPTAVESTVSYLNILMRDHPAQFVVGMFVLLYLGMKILKAHLLLFIGLGLTIFLAGPQLMAVTGLHIPMPHFNFLTEGISFK